MCWMLLHALPPSLFINHLTLFDTAELSGQQRESGKVWTGPVKTDISAVVFVISLLRICCFTSVNIGIKVSWLGDLKKYITVYCYFCLFYKHVGPRSYNVISSWKFFDKVQINWNLNEVAIAFIFWVAFKAFCRKLLFRNFVYLIFTFSFLIQKLVV